MGITLIHKSALAKKKPHEAKALILAGGAVSGGSFMAGGIKALNNYLVDFKINNFDIFVGISSGSMIATALMGGISPESILKSLDGTSSHFTPLTAWHYYRPNFSELVTRPAGFVAQALGWLPGRIFSILDKYPEWSHGALRAMWQFIMHPTPVTYDDMMKPILKLAGSDSWPSIFKLLPSGLFDNKPIETYFRHNIERNHLTNDFKKAAALTGKRLYITAMKLDGAERVVFGSDCDSSLTISEAIQASTALPGFYKPARIGGVDYVDGGVRETADIDIAVEKGAGLIVCYNPFRPYEPQEFVAGFAKRKEKGGGLAADGVMAVLNQIFRSFFHQRLHVALGRFKEDPDFQGDIILIEPRADDRAFFALNPLSLKNRVEAAKMGFESVRNSIERRYDAIAEIMLAHGIKMTKTTVEEKFKEISKPEASEEEIQNLLEGRRQKIRIQKLWRRARVKRVAGRVSRKKRKK